MSLWSVVGGLWSVAGRWAVVLYYAEVDDRVEVKLHVNFLTSDTFIYHTKYSILDHYTLALEFDCSLLGPGQYFLVFRAGQ